MINRIRVNKIKTTQEGYDKNLFGGWIWQYGRFQPQWTWDRSGKRIVLENKNTGERFVGLTQINRILKEKELEVETF